MRLNPNKRKHYLKIWPEFYKDVKSRRKRFEMRFNDRGYQVGDILVLQEFDPTLKDYTGSSDIIALVTYALTQKPFVPDGYICMSINVIAGQYIDEREELIQALQGSRIYVKAIDCDDSRKLLSKIDELLKRCKGGIVN
jgi:hypothetical protein